MKIKTTIVSCNTGDSKPVKQEVNGTAILPTLVFPGLSSLVLDRLGGTRRVPLAFKGSNLASGTPFLAKGQKILIHSLEVSKKALATDLDTKHPIFDLPEPTQKDSTRIGVFYGYQHSSLSQKRFVDRAKKIYNFGRRISSSQWSSTLHIQSKIKIFNEIIKFINFSTKLK